jgi:dihydrofolate synthase/folylpolyglutamate synthase
MVEVGMGGRLDSTNVLLPLAAAITNIGLDHTRYLGDTLEQIAFEKAGIIKPRIPVVVAETTPPARDIILARADELGSPVYLRDRDFQFEVTGPPFRQQFRYESRSLSLGPAPLSLAGVHQGENAATAVALAERILPSFPEINTESISKGLGSARWPCRLERVMDSPPVILDVAHNPDGARKIAHALSRCVTVLAVSSDKDAAGIIAALAPVTSVFILTRFQGARAMPMETLCAAASGHFYRTAPDLTEAIRLGLSLAGESAPLLITGSIFTAGEARQILIKQYGAPPLAF